MGNAPLDQEELEAIQAAVRESRSGVDRNHVAANDVGPLALIIDDRQAETARPNGIRIAERWARTAHRRLRQFVGGDFKVAVVNAEVVDGQPTRDELGGMWFATATPSDGRGSALIAIGGAMIESLAARLCGDSIGEVSDSRPPSPTALKIFEPVGSTAAAAAAAAWSEEQDCTIAISRNAAGIERTRRVLQDSDVIISIRLSLTGTVEGDLRLLARPATFVPPPTPTEAVPASREEIEAALGRVPVEVKVDLGSTSLTMTELAQLAAGSIVPLTSFVDDPLPIRCGDVVKAYGRPVVSRGVLSVEVDRLEYKEQEQHGE